MEFKILENGNLIESPRELKNIGEYLRAVILSISTARLWESTQVS